MKTFYSWLLKQRDRDDPVGDIARDTKLAATTYFDRYTPPKSSVSRKRWLAHYQKYGDRDCVAAFEMAWEEYEYVKKGLRNA